MGKAEEDFNLLESVADLLGLEEGDRDSFLSSGMKRIGHRPKLTWEDGGDDNNGESGDFFTSRRERRETRSTTSNRTDRSSRREGNDWQYGSRRTG